GSEVLQKLFESGNSPLSEQFMRWKLWARWSEFVGPTVAENTEPVGFHRGTLFLWVRNSTWMQQLSFMREHIQDSINKKMGKKEKYRDLKQPYINAIIVVRIVLQINSFVFFQTRYMCQMMIPVPGI
ncbi:MAG: DUF721 domain-containing protein, partial [Chryseobacterium sp.]